MGQNQKLSILLTVIISQLILGNSPVVSIELPGLLGNRLWGFCVAKIIAHELQYTLHCKSIYGFPYTYTYQPHYEPNGYSWDVYKTEQDIDLKGIISNKKIRNIKLHGYFQRYHYLEPYADLIRKQWLVLDSSLMHTVDPDDIVAHVRIHVDKSAMNFEYYKKALAMASYKQLYICTNEPKHPFLKNFDPYHPIIISARDFNSYYEVIPLDEVAKLGIEDFAFITSFNKIITSYSTYSWWAAFLSNATEIYAPRFPGDRGQVYYGDVNEKRYTYIDTDISFK